jgi:hypothetical protein
LPEEASRVIVKLHISLLILNPGTTTTSQGNTLPVSIDKPLRPLNLYCLFVVVNENHGWVLSIKPVNIFQMSVCGLGINKPDQLRGSRYISDITNDTIRTYRDENGIEHHPYQVEVPAEVSDSRRGDLDNHIVGNPVQWFTCCLIIEYEYTIPVGRSS